MSLEILPGAVREALMTLAHAEPAADTKDGTVATVRLAAGRALTVREVTRADVDGLDALFEGLSDEDRYRRFFGYSHPGRRFVEQMTRAGEEGGYRLVAALSGREDRLVAEAGYYMLPDGNGEFALTIAADWRGWLGPYLLDALVAAAAARGVPNLQADVLLENAQMLALVSHRGYVTLSHDPSQVRVAIGAAQPCHGRQTARAAPF
jgi:hypothetical protein